MSAANCMPLHRLKKVQGKKKRDTVARDAAAAAAGAPDAVAEFEEGEGSSDLLSSKDEDVIF